MDFIPGTIDLTENIIEKSIWEKLIRILENFDGHCGYKIPSLSIKESSKIPSFVIFTKHYILLLDIITDKLQKIDDDFWIFDNGTEIFARDILIEQFESEIDNRLKKDTRLYNRETKELILPIKKAIIFINNSSEDVIFENNSIYIDFILHSNTYESALPSLFEKLALGQELSNEIFDVLVSMFDGTDSYKKQKTRVRHLIYKDDYIKSSLDVTYKLDTIQRKVALQLPGGPQRIRGLAGTGKTIILCLKAALTMKNFADFKILFLFNTRSMYAQIRDLIETYYIRETGEGVNWNNIDILHAWGAKNEPGLYSEICKKLDIKPLTFNDVRRSIDPLGTIYQNLLSNQLNNIKPKYDLVLIDEAQDFPNSLFETVFHLTKGENLQKRIVWAYDDFQSLKGIQIKGPSELFGKDKEGNPNLADECLNGTFSGTIEKDYILSNSYRNPRINLMTAHGLALGIYRPEGIIDILNDEKSWNSIGYEIIAPQDKKTFSENDQMDIIRPETNSKNILERLLRENRTDLDKLISYDQFNSKKEELDNLIENIKKNIQVEKVDPTEIIVVSLDTKNAEIDFAYIRRKLSEHEIFCITPGFIEDASWFKVKGYVTLTTPYRAKGNESNIVFVVNAQQAITDVTLRTRNSLFVAITRSRGWCYISGNSYGSDKLAFEINSITDNYPHFTFAFPSESSLARSRIILSKDDFEIEKADKEIEKIFQENPELLIEKLKQNPSLLSQLNLLSHDD